MLEETSKTLTGKLLLTIGIGRILRILALRRRGTSGSEKREMIVSGLIGSEFRFR